jgi:protein TonB
MAIYTSFSFQLFTQVLLLLGCIILGRYLAKKFYPSNRYDPLKMRTPAFYLGLAWSLLVVIYAFNITAVTEEYTYEVEDLPPSNDFELINKRVVNPVVAKKVKYIPPVIDSIQLVDEDPIDTMIRKVKPIIEVTDAIGDTTAVDAPVVDVRPPAPTPPPLPPEPKRSDVPHVVVEDMPRFPACESENISKKEKDSCAKQALMDYVYKHVNYPSIARQNGIEGTVVVQFVIDQKGSITNIDIKRDIGGGCGQEVQRLLTEMEEDVGLWIPGRQQGRKVKVLFTLPVKFALH